MSEYKVIFHIDEIDKWKLLLGNVGNLLNGIDNENLHIEVLANSEAVKYYGTKQNLDTDINTMESLNNKGVKFVACNNALMAYNIKKDDIIHFVDIVPAGVVELVIKQSNGYAYIKP
ncbi:MAG: DsrE family protein [Tissierellia bacterium]|nr:DsrE family protein [Tissierellia bacterium]